MTQAELAERLGITPQAVSQYERGIKNPKLETVKRISEALGVLVPDLYPEGMQAMPILDWMESKGIPIVSSPRHVRDESDEEFAQMQRDEEENERNWYIHQQKLIDGINSDFAELNDKGQEEAAKRVHELTFLPEYSKEPDKK